MKVVVGYFERFWIHFRQGRGGVIFVSRGKSAPKGPPYTSTVAQNVKSKLVLYFAHHSSTTTLVMTVVSAAGKNMSSWRHHTSGWCQSGGRHTRRLFRVALNYVEIISVGYRTSRQAIRLVLSGYETFQNIHAAYGSKHAVITGALIV